MKYIGILALLLCLNYSCKSKKAVTETTPEEVKDIMEFHHNDTYTLTDVVEIAEKENKLIFVDVYADWCTPCKLMDEDVFTDEKIADFMKANFINYKVDGESHNGPNLGVMYGVAGYPTLLILDQKGRVLERNDGALYHSGLRGMAKEAIKKSKESI